VIYMSWKDAIRKDDIEFDEFGRDADERGELSEKWNRPNEFKFFLSARVSSMKDMPERELHALAEKILQKMVGEIIYDKKGSDSATECEIVSVSENR
tara:strand:+ start:123 stop:413 length:291 start_codon:yes stop_codon:yes gene_type:complete